MSLALFAEACQNVGAYLFASQAKEDTHCREGGDPAFSRHLAQRLHLLRRRTTPTLLRFSREQGLGWAFRAVNR